MHWPPKQTKVQHFRVVKISPALFMIEEHVYGEGAQETAIFSKDENQLQELAAKANQAGAFELLGRSKEETPEQKKERMNKIKFTLSGQV